MLFAGMADGLSCEIIAGSEVRKEEHVSLRIFVW